MNSLRFVAGGLCLGCASSPPPVPPRQPVRAETPEAARVPQRPVFEPDAMPWVEQVSEASPLVTFRVVFNSGSSDDPEGSEGITRLTARLMAEGGTESLTFEQFTRALFPMAARVQWHVDRDQTVFEAQVHSDRVTEFYPLLRDVLLRPRMAEADFTRVRTQSRADLTLELRGSSDEDLGREALQSLIYDGHRYAHPPVGTEEGLDALTVERVRSHRGAVFCAERAMAGVAGRVAPELARQFRADVSGMPRCSAERMEVRAVARPRGLHVVVIDKPTASATAISIGLPLAITRRDTDHSAVQFMTNYLGLHRQSVGVLYQTIREARGLNYGDYAYAEHFTQEPATRFPRTGIQRRLQYASLWIRPVPARNAHFALRAALRATRRALEEGIAAEDFVRVRTFLDGYLGLYAQTAAQRLGFAMDDRYYGSERPWADRLRGQWAALDPSGVRDAARRHLSATDLWVAIVAPNARELAESLVSDAPSPITYESPKPAEVMAEDREIQQYPLGLRREDVRVIPLSEVFRTRGSTGPSTPSTPIGLRSAGEAPRSGSVGPRTSALALPARG